MPYIRSLFAALLILSIGLALFADDHPYFGPATFWYLAGLIAVLFCMAATQEFFLQFVALLFAAYFIQRVIVLYFLPGEFIYSRTMLPTSEVVSKALLFVTLCAAAMLLGWWLARLRLTRRPAMRRAIRSSHGTLSIGSYSITFERLFLYYAVVSGSLLILQLVLLLGAGVGAADVVYDPAFAPFYRLSFIMNSSGFLPFYALARRESGRNIRIVAILLIALQLSLAAAATSKGTLIMVAAYSIICWHFAGRRIPRKMAWIGLAAVLFSAFVFFPLMSIARLVVINVLADPEGWRSLFSTIVSTREAAVTPSALFFSARLGGFDWLAGLMTFGRDQFPSWVSTSGDFIHILNDMVPGDIVDVPGYLPIEQLMPMYLRGIPAVEMLGGHAEVMGVAGMAYLYYGLTLGPIFFFVWSFVTTKVLRSNLNAIVKILYFSCFVVGMVIGGGYVVTVERFDEGMLTLALLILLDILVRKILFAGPDARLRRRRPGLLPAPSR